MSFAFSVSPGTTIRSTNGSGIVLGEEEHEAVFAGASVADDVKDELQHELPGSCGDR